MIRWCNYDWNVKSGGPMGPGSNFWSTNNVWVDTKGDLHLKIAKNGDTWYCAEIWTKNRLPFGKYQFWVISWLDQLDKNVVLGLFNYPTSDVGPDGTNEIDIEIGRWGNPYNWIGGYTAWPNKSGVNRWYWTFPFALTEINTTHRFVWRKNSVYFQSLQGHRDWNNNDHELASKTTPTSYSKYVAQKSMPMHINLWLYGLEPSDGQPVEVVIRKFTYSTL
jgi:hypothetical protein